MLIDGILCHSQRKNQGDRELQSKEMFETFRLAYLVETEFLDLYYSS